MAIESIGDKVFTTKSDVWSFGVLMWEFFTLGGNPYPGIEVDEEFYKRLKNGYRMEKTEHCPDDVYQIMKDCWHAEPKERPEFSQLSDVLGALLESGVRQHYIDLNDPYLEMNEQLLTHDYLNVGQDYKEPSNRLYVNTETVCSEFYGYDTLPPIRSISDAPVVEEAVEAVPMIQLEPLSNEIASGTNLNQPSILSYTPDYLQMGISSESPSAQDDSVFY